MPKRTFKLTKDQDGELYAAFLQCVDATMQIRFQAVLLYGRGYTVEDVLDITGCSRSSLMEWCRIYRKDGLDGLYDKRKQGNHSKLTEEQITELRTRLHESSPSVALSDDMGKDWQVASLAMLVSQRFDVIYKRRDSYHQLFKRCGFEYDKKAQVYKPVVAAGDKQRAQKKAWGTPRIDDFRKRVNP